LGNWDVVKTVVAACCTFDTRFVVWNFSITNRSLLVLFCESCCLLHILSLSTYPCLISLRISFRIPCKHEF
jgi:hypothetical protein